MACASLLSLVRCTFVGNNAGDGGTGGGGGGIVVASTHTSYSRTLRNVLVAGNLVGTGGVHYTSWRGGVAGAGLDLCGSFVSLGHNLIGSDDGQDGITNGVQGDIMGTWTSPINPLLGPLADNGGLTQTRALLPGSPAMDAGDDTLAGTSDQRGQLRPSGAHVDIGAFEYDISGYPSPQIESVSDTVSNDTPTGLSSADIETVVNPGGLSAAVYIEYGIGTNYGMTTTFLSAGCGTDDATNVIRLAGLAPGSVYHYRVVTVGPAGASYGEDCTLTSTPAGDRNGDGMVDQDDLNVVFGNYWQDNPTIITNFSMADSSRIQVEITNSLGWDLTVQMSTNLMDWETLPDQACPAYQFDDPDITNSPNRSYRLLAP